MRSRHGMTLVELLLTCILVTYMSFAMIDLISAKRHYSSRLSTNVSKILLLESIKNRIIYDLESGKTVDEVLEQGYSLIKSKKIWEIKIYPSDCASVSSIIVSIKSENENKFRSTEVILP